MLPIAVLLWRYLGSYHAGLPTAHDVVTGFWQPTEAEAEAGLQGPHDFCTLVSLVAAQYSLREAVLQAGTDDAWDHVLAASEIPVVADESLGYAAMMLATAFGLDVPEDYDATCSNVAAWP